MLKDVQENGTGARFEALVRLWRKRRILFDGDKDTQGPGLNTEKTHLSPFNTTSH